MPQGDPPPVRRRSTTNGKTALARRHQPGTSTKGSQPYYGAAAGDQLTALLREHILIAADLIAAARAGDATAVATREARWTANANDIAAFLHAADPRFFRLADMQAMMHEHLRLTTDEVLARLHQDWVADVAAYDLIHVQGLQMADMLSAGIIAQFPRRFR